MRLTIFDNSQQAFLNLLGSYRFAISLPGEIELNSSLNFTISDNLIVIRLVHKNEFCDLHLEIVDRVIKRVTYTSALPFQLSGCIDPLELLSSDLILGWDQMSYVIATFVRCSCVDNALTKLEKKASYTKYEFSH